VASGVRAGTHLVALAAAALALAGCGGNDDSSSARPALPAELGRLCDETRAAVEVLGEPRDVGAEVFRPWAQLGRDFVTDVRRLRGTTPRQRRQLDRLADFYKGFYDNLQISYDLFRAGRSTSIKMTLERAYALLASGEALAVRMGAPECAVRPFEEG
jgi:hypothetical protein